MRVGHSLLRLFRTFLVGVVVFIICVQVYTFWNFHNDDKIKDQVSKHGPQTARGVDRLTPLGSGTLPERKLSLPGSGNIHGPKHRQKSLGHHGGRNKMRPSGGLSHKQIEYNFIRNRPGWPPDLGIDHEEKDPGMVVQDGANKPGRADTNYSVTATTVDYSNADDYYEKHLTTKSEYKLNAPNAGDDALHASSPPFVASDSSGGLKSWHEIPDDPCENVTYTTFQTGSYCLKHDRTVYAMVGAKPRTPCLLDGTVTIEDDGDCVCQIGWTGLSCNIPPIISNSDYPKEKGVAVQKIPRRIIYAFAFSHEFDMLEARLYEFGNIVDLYVILESNYTAYGLPKERLLHKKMQNGYLQGFQHKILYVSLDHFPAGAKDDGWIIDALLRNHLQNSLKQIRNTRETDIFVLTDADEMPRRETLLFLKVNFGYPQPIGFQLRHTVFGFFWEGPKVISHAYGACTMRMLEYVFDWQPYMLRSATANMQAFADRVDDFRHKQGGRIGPWNFGSEYYPAGWHCSWCFDPSGILFKMTAAHVSDRPRWGNFPQKRDLNYIRSRINNGTWFDDTTQFHFVQYNDTNFEVYAPLYMRKHENQYKHLLRYSKYEMIRIV